MAKRGTTTSSKSRVERAFSAWKRDRPGVASGGAGDEFTLFALEAILESDDLYETALEDSLIGGSGDGGIDAMLTLYNNEAIDAPLAPREIATEGEVTLHLLQATESPQMTLKRLQRARTTIGEILDLDEELTIGEPGADYSESFVEQARIFRETVANGKGKKLKVEVVFHLANTGDVTNAKDDFARERRRIEGLETGLPDAWIAVNVYGARELVKLRELKYRISRLPLDCEKVVTFGPGSGTARSRLARVKLSAYDKFVTEASKNTAGETERRIRQALFAGNVRHFRGTRGVNAKIRESLDAASQGTLSAAFWSLNNGITVLASSIEGVGKELTIHDPLVVNGLQTSFVISSFFGGNPGPAADEAIVVKVIVETDPAAQAAIIRATNQQTPVQAWSLYAAEERQVEIAEHFEQEGWFYERLAGQARWDNHPRGRTIDMRFLAQAALAIGLNRPEDARARPGSVFTEKGYADVFNNTTDDEAYFWMGRTLKAVDEFLLPRKGVGQRGERATLRFHVARQVVARTLLAAAKTPSQLHALVTENREFTNEELAAALNDVRAAVEKTGETPERVSKSIDLRDELDVILKGLQQAAKKTPVKKAVKKAVAKKRAS